MFMTGTKKQRRTWNIMLWVSLFMGTGLLMCLYSMEWYARINCPKAYVSHLHFSHFLIRHLYCFRTTFCTIWRRIPGFAKRHRTMWSTQKRFWLEGRVHLFYCTIFELYHVLTCFACISFRSFCRLAYLCLHSNKSSRTRTDTRKL